MIQDISKKILSNNIDKLPPTDSHRLSALEA